VKLLKLPSKGAPAYLAEQTCDALIDIVQAQAAAVYEAMRAKCRHFIWCGSLWMLGPPAAVPTPEVRFGPALTEGYQRRMDELMELRLRARGDGVAFTAVLPPNICGPGKIPLELRGGRDIEVHRAHARGEPVTLFRGCNTLVGPCDVEDVAQGFRLAVENPDPADGEMFNVGAPYALTVPQLVRLLGEIYGKDIPIRWASCEQFRQLLPDPGASNHFFYHMCPDISKTRQKLGYQPRYTPEESMARAVEWMRRQRLL